VCGHDAFAGLRISMPELLGRKRQHAARTGEIFLSAYQLI
jgi:hypothetical protein